MRVFVNYDLCESNGVCEAIAPDSFRLDDKDKLQLLRQDVARADVDKIERAVVRCPKAALRLESERRTGGIP